MNLRWQSCWVNRSFNIDAEIVVKVYSKQFSNDVVDHLFLHYNGFNCEDGILLNQDIWEKGITDGSKIPPNQASPVRLFRAELKDFASKPEKLLGFCADMYGI
jgi:hypothetical protein